MYRIIDTRTGAELAVADDVHYIGVSEEGNYVPEFRKNATGILVNAVSYALPGHEALYEYGPVTVERFDGFKRDAHTREIADLDAIMVDQEYRLTLLELGLTDEA